MSRPGAVPFTNDDTRAVAADHGVCVRPVLRRVHDRQTGEMHKLVIPCGSTREYLCPPCAKKAQRLRMQQCEEGWHLEEEPLPPEPDADPEELDEDDDGQDGEPEGEGSLRRVRSTRRRSEMADLPKVPVEHRSIGRTFTAPDGKTYRPSMFVTLTLPTYGKVVTSRKGKTVPGPAPQSTPLPTTTGAPRWMRCTSRACSTGGYRTCADVRGSRCSTSPPSRNNAASHPTRMSR